MTFLINVESFSRSSSNDKASVNDDGIDAVAGDIESNDDLSEEEETSEDEDEEGEGEGIESVHISVIENVHGVIDS